MKLQDDHAQPIPNIKFGKTRPKTTNTRRWALREAERLVKAHLTTTGNTAATVTVTTEMPTRQVLVNNTAVFTQTKNRLRGDFHGEFSHLQLPSNS